MNEYRNDPNDTTMPGEPDKTYDESRPSGRRDELPPVFYVGGVAITPTAARPARVINGHLPNESWKKHKGLYTEAEAKIRGTEEFCCPCWLCVPVERLT